MPRPAPSPARRRSCGARGGRRTGAASLTYTWAATTLPSGAAPPAFSANGSNAAQSTTATFSPAGTYVLTVTITDPGGLTATSQVSVAVNQTLTSISLAGQSGSATAFDQFGNPLADQPAFIEGSDTITSPLALNGNVAAASRRRQPIGDLRRDQRHGRTDGQRFGYGASGGYEQLQRRHHGLGRHAQRVQRLGAGRRLEFDDRRGAASLFNSSLDATPAAGRGRRKSLDYRRCQGHNRAIRRCVRGGHRPPEPSTVWQLPPSPFGPPINHAQPISGCKCLGNARRRPAGRIVDDPTDRGRFALAGAGSKRFGRFRPAPQEGRRDGQHVPMVGPGRPVLPIWAVKTTPIPVATGAKNV